MKVYPRLFAKLFCSPLLLHEPVRVSFERAILQRMDLVPVLPIDDPEDPEPQEPESARVARIYQAVGDVAIIQVNGVIDKYISAFEMECYGGCDLNDIDHALALADGDPAINRVVLCINSPGGSASGVAETGQRIADMRSRKEMLARVDVMAASAGYWLASQCDRIDASESAALGSIGVYCALLDATRALEMEGYKVELVKAGKFKAMGAPFKPLTDEERALFQEGIDTLYTAFTSQVVSGRAAAVAKVSSETMQGQCFYGSKAVEAGLADDLITATLDEYISALLSGAL
jgi:signal peptide peptidase SppA